MQVAPTCWAHFDHARHSDCWSDHCLLLLHSGQQYMAPTLFAALLHGATELDRSGEILQTLLQHSCHSFRVLGMRLHCHSMSDCKVLSGIAGRPRCLPHCCAEQALPRRYCRCLRSLPRQLCRAWASWPGAGTPGTLLLSWHPLKRSAPAPAMTPSW